MGTNFGIGFVVGASLSSTVATTFSTVSDKIKATQRAMADTQVQSKSLATAAATQTQLAEIRAQRAQVAQRMVALRAQKAEGSFTAVSELRQAVAQHKALGAELGKAEIAHNKATVAAKKHGIAVADYAVAYQKAGVAAERHQARLQKLTVLQNEKDKRQQLQGQLGGVMAGVMTVAAPIKLAIDFESNMADAAKTIEGMRDDAGNLTPEYYKLEEAVKRMGRSLPLTHAELAKLFAAGGQQGMTATADLKEFATTSAHMSVAFGMSTEESAEAIGGYRTALKMTMPEVRSMLDLMNQYANTGSASEKGIADIVRRVGSLGDVGGVAAKPMTALAATLDSMKVAPEVAATGIKNLILAMTAGKAATKGQQKAFASLGINTIALSKKMQKDGPAGILSVLEAVKKLPKHKQLSTLQEIFGKESLSSIAPLLSNLDLLKTNLRIASDESSYAGAMQKEFENRSKTTANSLILAKNRVAELGITLGSVLLPSIVTVLETVGPAVSAFTDFASANQGVTTAVVGAVAGMVAFKVVSVPLLFAFSGLRTLWHGGALMLQGLRMATLAHSAASVVAMSVSLRARAVALTSAVATRSVALATSAATAAQWLMNAALAANPVGLAITAVAALGGWFAWCYTQAGTFTGAVGMMWDQLKAVVPVAEVVEAAFVGLTTFVADLWNGVSLYDAGAKLIGSLWDGVKAMWERVKAPFTAIAGFFGIGDTTVPTLEMADAHGQEKTVAQPPAQLQPAKAIALPPQPATTTPPAKAAKVVSPPSPTPVPQPEKASTQRPEKARPLATAAVQPQPVALTPQSTAAVQSQPVPLPPQSTAAVQPQPVALTLQDKAVATPQPANTVVQPAQPVQAALPPVQQQPAKTVALPVQPTSSAQPEKTLALPTPSATTTPPAKAAKAVSPPSPTPVPQPEKTMTQRPEKARPLATAAVQPQPAPLPPQEKAVATPQPTKAAKVAFQPAQPTAPPAKATQPTAQELGQAKSQHIPVTPVSALSTAQNTAAPAVTQKPQGATPISLNSTFSFTLTGVDDMAFAQRVMAAIESRKGEVERLLSTIVSDQTRLAYGR